MCDRFISKKKEEHERGQSMNTEMFVFIVALHKGNATGSILTAIMYFK